MLRKIVKQGSATMMISLPSKWVKINNLGKGDEVSVEEEGRDLIIRSGESEKRKEVTLNFSINSESPIRTALTNAYRRGYNKIIIAHVNSMKIIRNIVEEQLLGFEIIKENSNSCEISNITEPSIEQFENIFNKEMMNIHELFKTAKTLLNNKESDYNYIENKITQFDNFCRRVSVKSKRNKNYELEWTFYTSINRGQREIYHLLNFIEKNKIKDKREIIELLDQTEKIFELLIEAYKKKDLKIIEKIHEIDKKIHQHGYLLMKKGEDAIALHKILSSSRQFYLGCSPLSGIIMDVQ